MGFDQPKQSSSSGAVIAIVVAVLLIGIIGLIAVAGASLFLVGTSRQESRVTAIAEANRAVAEELRAKGEAMHAAAQAQHVEEAAQLKESRVVATPAPRLNFEVTIDREGNASVDGEGIDLDGLRGRLALLKQETGKALSVQINADPDCPAKLFIPVLDVCEEVGDAKFRVASSADANASSDES